MRLEESLGTCATERALFCCLYISYNIYDEWPKEKRSEIMFSFFVSDMHSRKLQQRLNEKLWLVENYFRTHGGWRSNGPSHISQCSQNPSKSINNALSLITAPPPPAPLHPPCCITTLQRPRPPLEAAADNLCMLRHTPRRSKVPSVLVSSPSVFSTPFLLRSDWYWTRLINYWSQCILGTLF